MLFFFNSVVFFAFCSHIFDNCFQVTELYTHSCAHTTLLADKCCENWKSKSKWKNFYTSWRKPKLGKCTSEVCHLTLIPTSANIRDDFIINIKLATNVGANSKFDLSMCICGCYQYIFSVFNRHKKQAEWICTKRRWNKENFKWIHHFSAELLYFHVYSSNTFNISFPDSIRRRWLFSVHKQMLSFSLAHLHTYHVSVRLIRAHNWSLSLGLCVCVHFSYNPIQSLPNLVIRFGFACSRQQNNNKEYIYIHTHALSPQWQWQRLRPKHARIHTHILPITFTSILVNLSTFWCFSGLHLIWKQTSK